jgi:hypothetical protein
MRRWAKVALALSGVVPLISLLPGARPNATLMYSLFVLLYFMRHRLTVRPGSRWIRVRFILWTVLLGLMAETLAWTDNFLAANPQPALFHPQLIPNLLLGMGLYTGWAVAWILLTRRWHYRVVGVFILTGLYGIVVEQNAAVLIAGLNALPLGLFLWLYVLVTYGGVMAAGFLPFREVWPGQRKSLLQIPAAWVAIVACSLLVFYGWALVMMGLGGLPPPRPITEFPFW